MKRIQVSSVSARRVACSALLATTATLAPAAAQEQTLRFTMTFAETHFTYTEAVNFFAEEVEAATDGRIQIEIFAGGQLGNNAADIIGGGLADGGLVVPSYEPDKMPLTSVAELPAMHSTACESVPKLWHMIQEGGPLYEAEYAPLGLHPIFGYNLQPYELMTSDTKIASLEDVAGLKIRANGPAQDRTVRALGGVPVRVSGPELYDALNRGTVDGGMWLNLSTRLYSLEGVLNHGVKGTQLGAGGVNILAVSEDVWQELDAETQQIFMEAGQKAAENMCSWLDSTDAVETEWLIENEGFESVTLSEEEAARWTEAVAPVQEEWATEMDASGRPGTEMLEIYRSLP